MIDLSVSTGLIKYHSTIADYCGIVRNVPSGIICVLIMFVVLFVPISENYK